MIELSKIYDKTDGGKDIFTYYHPDWEQYFNSTKKFKLREKERTPSAMFHKGKNGVWYLVDYGDETVSPIEFFMQQEALRPDQFYEAVKRLAMRYGVDDYIDPKINRPRIEYHEVQAGQCEGFTSWKFTDEIPEKHLKILGPKVTAEVAASLHWHEAEYFSKVVRAKDSARLEVQYKYSTPDYPIFMRECVTEDGEVFYKVYEPLNPDKAWRFQYAPAGVKPANFINGLSELRDAVNATNAEGEVKDTTNGAAKVTSNTNGAAKVKSNINGAAEIKSNPNTQYRIPNTRIPAAVICSGERDALCCKAFGYHPIWFNSETHQISAYEMHLITSLAEEVYNIPDLDDTGVRKGKQLALAFPEVKTVWLPGWLNEFTDNRGRKSKDLRDWSELRRNETDFRSLLDDALPARFWEITSSERTGRTEVNILNRRLYHFLWLNGFATLHDDNKDQARLIRIEGNVVSDIKGKDVRRFVREWAEEQHLPECVQNVLATTTKLTDSALENLREVRLDFMDYTPTSQTYHFPGKVVTIKADGIREEKSAASASGHFVWSQSVIQHPFKLLPPMFEIKEVKGADGARSWDIELSKNIPSNVLKYLINTSRLFWREEMEERFNVTEKDGTVGFDFVKADEYASNNHFRIDGEGLTQEQIAKQKLNLISKIQGIGYMFHKYKSPSHAWAPLCMDNKIGENGQCNGRSGKSFLFTSISNILSMVALSGRDSELMKNKHVFDRVHEGTNFVMVDDCSASFSVDDFYDVITGKMIINPKCQQSIEIPFEESPKFVFTTNYVPRDFSASSEARMFYMVFSDYYHERSEENDYLESRSIRDDFQMDLFTRQYPEEMWNADINFFLQCLQFYLSHCQETLKIMPPMENIKLRKSRQDMGSNFEQWADAFFSPESGHLDTEIEKSYVIQEYMKYVPSLRVTPHSFTKQMKAYCAFADHIHCLNPEDLGQKGRIQHRKDGKLLDYFYLRSEREYQKMQEAKSQLHLDFPTPSNPSVSDTLFSSTGTDDCPF